MATRKKPAPRSRTTAKTQPRRSAKTKALAMTEPVKREKLGPPLLDSQMALLRAMMSWSPASIMVGQQAAFWRGFAKDAGADRKLASRGVAVAKRRSSRAARQPQ